MADGSQGMDLERRIMDQRNHMVYTDKLHKDHIFDAYTLNKQLDGKNASLQRLVDDLRMEVNHWKLRFEDSQKQLAVLKRDQQGMMGTNYDNLNHMHRVHTHNSTLHSQAELEGLRNLELQNQIRQLTLENESLKHRLDSYEDTSKLSMANLSSMLSEKGRDMNDMKWKLNDALELKRRSETDKETMQFELENLRARYVADLKEKLAQQQRNFEDTMDLKSLEFKELLDKYLKLETDYSIVFEKNRRLLDEVERGRMTAEQDRQTAMNITNLNRSVALPQQLTVQAPFNNSNFFQTANSAENFKPRKDKQLWNKMEAVLDMYESSSNEQVARLAFSVWRLKYQMKTKDRQGYEVDKLKSRPILLSATTPIDGVRNMNDGVLIVLSFMRESINDAIFELFTRSVSTASSKKQNSLILFILNMREFKSSRVGILTILLDTYSKLRSLAKKFIPSYSAAHNRLLAQLNGEENQRLTAKISDENFARVDQVPNSEVFRDNINQWIEATLTSCIQKHNDNPTEKNRDFMFLYRLLTINYRIKYPLRGKSFNPDVDLKVYLEHKICSTLKK